MSCSSKNSKEKFIPGSDADCEDIFTYAFIVEENTVEFIKSHGSIMFIVRGLPGTGKKSLIKLIESQYPRSSSFSANNYFKETFSGQMRTKKNLPESHFHCHKNVLKACGKGVHPIIVHNTHVRKKEMSEYLNYASRFNYTVIIISTSDKFEVTPKILAKSNTAGLGEEYFQERIKQWEIIPPIFTGWFINQDASSYIIKEMLSILDVLKTEGRFCSILRRCEKDDFSEYYKIKKLLFCAAGYGENNSCDELKSYFLSENVVENNGKCFEITIFSFLFTQSAVLALVHVDKSMEDLIFRPNKTKDPEVEGFDIDGITSRLNKLSFEKSSSNLLDYSKTVPLSEIQEKSSSEQCFETRKDIEDIKMSNCSFIHVAESEEKIFFPYKVQRCFTEVMDSSVDFEGFPREREQQLDYKINFVSSRMCLVQLKKPFVIKSVFTGLYV